MYKIHIISIGKNKEKWLKEALLEYQKRLSSIATLYFDFVKDNEALLEKVSKEKNVIALDMEGESFSSEDFSKKMLSLLEKGGSQLTLVIGGVEGLPEPLQKLPLISLSKMTFTHQMCRLILVEQLYRAFLIDQKSAYHTSRIKEPLRS